MLVREQLICGAQVHVDVNDHDLAVAVTHRVAPWLPVLLALSASSPFWLRRGDRSPPQRRDVRSQIGQPEMRAAVRLDHRLMQFCAEPARGQLLQATAGLRRPQADGMELLLHADRHRLRVLQRRRTACVCWYHLHLFPGSPAGQAASRLTLPLRAAACIGSMV
jgi:Glutamate-cysteine ligase family 2(GCS2)